MVNSEITRDKKRWGCLHILFTMIIILLIAIPGSMWWLKRNVYAKEFTPVTLNTTERVELETKLIELESANPAPVDDREDLDPEIYREIKENRRVVLSERELNSLIAKDPVLAKHVAIDLADDTISVKIITPMEPGIPIVGGKTFKLSVGVTLRYENEKPVVIMRGVSLGGIPLPGAWWGDIKGRNLVEEFGEEGGFWDLFSKGVENIEVKDGEFILHLKE